MARASARVWKGGLGRQHTARALAPLVRCP